ncbi:MAG TPA: hypothetical protein VGH33_13155, partial [Isosphaeraceae bacterium]
VAADGTHGSTTPPRWAGLEAVHADPDASLAAYGIDHTSIAATLSGRASSYGHPTSAAEVALATALFGGPPPPVPSSWYVALLTSRADPLGLRFSEPPADTGYARAAVANTAANFGASSSGSKTSGAAIAFPTATAPYTVQSLALFPSAAGGQAWAVVQLESPLVVTPGMAPTVPAGGLTFRHVPYKGQFAGGMTDFGWGRCYDALFGGAALDPPKTWYAALSTAPASRTTAAPSEPTGNGYARVAIPAERERWQVALWSYAYGQPGDARNASPVAFPAPTGPWGRCVAAALLDAPSGGNAWFLATTTGHPSPADGTPAPTFAPGALTLAVD